MLNQLETYSSDEPNPKSKMKKAIHTQFTVYIFTLLASLAFAQGPEVTSWIINTDGNTGYGGFPSNTQAVAYTSTDVYVGVSGIPDYEIGPWTGNPNIPVNTDFTFKITRNPVENTAVDVATPLGHIGVWKNGVTLFNAKDAMSYNNQNVWFQNAIVVEAVSFDECLGHPNQTGEYHLHLNPTCLYDDTDATQHSPLLGYAFDGFPIYGGYGFANADGSGAVIRIESSFQIRDISDRTTLSDGTVLNAAQYGPAINAQYPLGYYITDFEYVENLGQLDEHNGRFSVTPEYPNGIYCYFTTIDENYDAVFPYIIGLTYYGTVQAGNTGPNSGNNIVPGNATVYIPDAIEEAIEINFTISYTASAWMVQGSTISEWKIYNATGQLISTGTANEILHQNFTSGLYFMELITDDKTVVLKLMK